MDPITCASQAFLKEADLFWRSGRGRILRIVAAGTHRTHVIKSLRIAEHAPENRWPLFLYESPFVDTCSYWTGLEESIRQDYEHIRAGAAEEGVALPVFELVEATPCDLLGPVERAAVHIERAGALLGDKLDGAFIALVPARVTAAAGWRESIAALARIPFSHRVRLAVLDLPDGPAGQLLGPGSAQFVLHAGELGAWLKQLGPKPSAGPPRRARAMHAHADIEAARTLRSLLIDAALAGACGERDAAAVLFREATTHATEKGIMLDPAVQDAFRAICLAAAGAQSLHALSGEPVGQHDLSANLALEGGMAP